MQCFTGLVATFAGLAACWAQVPDPASRGQPGTGPSRHDIVACYAFFDRAGRPAAESLYWAPATARLALGGRAIKLTPKLDAGRPSGPGAYRWLVDSLTDSLHVSFSSGFSGTEFVLALDRHGDTLHGRAREHWDSRPRFTAEASAASAVHIACPDTARDERRPLFDSPVG